MIVLLCIDDNNGMLFHCRRQSRDRALTEHILNLTETTKLWISPYSLSLFSEGDSSGLFVETTKTSSGRFLVDEQYLLKAGPGDYCFVEDKEIAGFTDRIEKVILFKWNRVYPADTFLSLDLSLWRLTETEDFAGYSHEKITKEIYQR